MIEGSTTVVLTSVVVWAIAAATFAVLRARRQRRTGHAGNDTALNVYHLVVGIAFLSLLTVSAEEAPAGMLALPMLTVFAVGFDATATYQTDRWLRRSGLTSFAIGTAAIIAVHAIDIAVHV